MYQTSSIKQMINSQRLSIVVVEIFLNRELRYQKLLNVSSRLIKCTTKPLEGSKFHTLSQKLKFLSCFQETKRRQRARNEEEIPLTPFITLSLRKSIKMSKRTEERFLNIKEKTKNCRTMTAAFWTFPVVWLEITSGVLLMMRELVFNILDLYLLGTTPKYTQLSREECMRGHGSFRICCHKF